MQLNKTINSEAPATQATSYIASKVRKLKCMFTTQVSKKRKAWSDGLLKIFFSGGTYHCSLIDSSKIRETSLVGRQLESIEVQKLKKNEEIELEFEGYLVTVLAGNEYDETKIGPPLKLPKFVPPSTYVPVQKPPNHQSMSQMPPSDGLTNRPGAAPYSYKVTVDELDELWDRETGASTARTDHGPGNQQDNMNQLHHRSSYVEKGSSMQAPTMGYNHQQPSHSLMRSNSTGQENGQRQIDNYFTAKSGSSRDPDRFAAHQSHSVHRTGHFNKEGATHAAYRADKNPGNTHDANSTLNVPANDPRQQRPRYSTVPTATSLVRAPADAVPINANVNAQSDLLRAPLLSNTAATSLAYRSNQREPSSSADTENMNGRTNYYVGSPASVPVHHQYGKASSSAPVTAPAVSQATASNQPAGYSTIIGSSVWDSD